MTRRAVRFQGAAAIEDSLAAFSARCADPTAAVYARVFRVRPALLELFRRDARGLVRGEMLAQAFDVILDYVGERRFAATLIAAEARAHEGYDVSRLIFTSLFESIRDAARDALAQAWTPDMEDAWSALLIELRALVDAGCGPVAGE